MEKFSAAQGDLTPYICGSCQEPVFVLPDGKIYRPCGCPEDTVLLANMEAICRGAGAATA